MKITKAHLAVMKEAIDKVLEANPSAVEMYNTGKFNNSSSVKDLQRRFCFDLSYAAKLTKFYCDEVYSYANDDHIYTALKAICPQVTKQY